MAQPRKFIEEGPSLADTLQRALMTFSARPLFGVLDGDAMEPAYLSASTILDSAGRLACALCSHLSLPSSSVVAVAAHNCPEWLLADFACAFADLVPVGFLPSWPQTEFALIAQQTEVRAAITSIAILPKFLQAACEEGSHLRHLVVLQATVQETHTALSAMGLALPAHVTLHTFDSLVDGTIHDSSGHTCFTHTGVPFDLMSGLGVTNGSSNDTTPFTIIYSSGTTGQPKGIVISKRRWKYDQLRGAGGALFPSVTVAHQALAHGCDRGICWQAALAGGQVVFVSSSDHHDLLRKIELVRPTYLMAMSHFWTHIYCDFKKEWKAAASPGAVADWYQKYRRALGGRLNLAITGGSHTSRQVVAWMKSCLQRGDMDPDPNEAVLVKNAYGSTEFPGISVDGDISTEIELQLVDVPELGYTRRDVPYPRGEIKVRYKDAENLLPYYLKRPEQTAASFTSDGWYLTGDIGMLDHEHRLHVIDRRKSVIELYVDGRSVWVPFSAVEALYDQAPGVERTFLFGDRNEPVVLACVIPEATAAQQWARAHHLPAETDLSTLCAMPEFQAHILHGLHQVGQTANRQPYEIPGAILLEPTLWAADTGELTITGKLRREVLGRRYKPRFDQLYATLEEKGVEAQGVEAQVTIAPTTDPLDFPLSPLKEEVAAVPPVQKPLLLAQTHFPGDGDFLDFDFKVPPGTPAADVRNLEDALQQAKLCCRYLRSQLPLWKATKLAHDNAALCAVDVAVAEGGSWVVSAVASLPNQPVPDDFRRLVHVFLQRQLCVRRAHAASQLTRSEEVPEFVAARRQLHFRTRVSLQAACDRAGVRMPYQIYSSLWAVPPVDPTLSKDSEGDGGLGNSIGDVLVTCALCGATLEGDGVYADVPRHHSLDMAELDYCMACFQLLQETLRPRLPPAMVSGLRLTDAFACETKLIYWLQDKVKNVDPAQDTPASFISGAFDAYGPRLALGFPDPDLLPVQRQFGLATSPLCDAAGFTLVLHDQFRWITYGQLGFLARRVAKALLALDLPVGSFVGICGYNSIEWAVTDFACALAGLVSVGLHTTSDNVTMSGVLNRLKLACIVTTSDRLRPDHNYWTLTSILPQCPYLTQLVLLDAQPETVSLPASCTVQLSSLLSAVAPAGETLDKLVALAPVLTLHGVGRECLTTVYFTSGSTGPPKGVMCSASNFVNDIRGRVFVVPLVTPSYIPLSHTSDRMKLWEFLGNGGRVGFCYYAADNWSEHETSKKGELLRTDATNTHNVEPLLAQIQALAPSGIACPPRIWSGLFAVYKRLKLDGMQTDAAQAYIRNLLGPRLQAIFTGGAPTSPEVEAFVHATFPHLPLRDSYGATECGAITEDGLPLAEKGVEVALLDLPDLGFSNRDTVGPRGEIIVRSPNMTVGYLNDPVSTRAVFLPDGWYRTGDLGTVGSVAEKGQVVWVQVAENQPQRSAVIYRGSKFTVLERIVSVCSLNNGEMVYPARLGTLLSDSPLVHQIFCHVSRVVDGVICLVVPSALARAAQTSDNEVLSDLVRLATEKGCREFELPRAVAQVNEPFTERNGLLNSQYKQVRPHIQAVYAEQLAALEHSAVVRGLSGMARCCTTHANLYYHQLNPDDANMASICAQYERDSQGSCWAVLVGGESQGLMCADKSATREGKYLGGHCSVENLGLAYGTVVQYIPKERIIVILQLQETMDWLEEAVSASDERLKAMAGLPRLRATFARRLHSTRVSCSQLIKDGGADYDGELVNPATVVKILNSHGNCHSTLPPLPRVDGAPLPAFCPDPLHDEWYFHMPYGCPPADQGLYDFVGYQGYYADMKEDDVPRTHTSLLYAQMLFYAFHRMLEQAPCRTIVPLYQFCLSGGCARFLELKSYHRYFNTHMYPIYLMVTSGEYQASLSDFLPIFLGQLQLSMEESQGRDTLEELYRHCADLYWDRNRSVHQFNETTHASDSAEALTLLFGQINRHIGQEQVARLTIAELFQGLRISE